MCEEPNVLGEFSLLFPLKVFNRFINSQGSSLIREMHKCWFN